MTALALNNHVAKGTINKAGSRKEGLFQKIKNAYKENQAEIICGLMMMTSGDPGEAYKLYNLLSSR